MWCSLLPFGHLLQASGVSAVCLICCWFEAVRTTANSWGALTIGYTCMFNPVQQWAMQNVVLPWTCTPCCLTFSVLYSTFKRCFPLNQCSKSCGYVNTLNTRKAWMIWIVIVSIFPNWEWVGGFITRSWYTYSLFAYILDQDHVVGAPEEVQMEGY